MSELIRKINISSHFLLFVCLFIVDCYWYFLLTIVTLSELPDIDSVLHLRINLDQLLVTDTDSLARNAKQNRETAFLGAKKCQNNV